MSAGRRVVVTGIGAVTCFGMGVDRLWKGLVDGRSGRASIAAFDASAYRSDVAAEVPLDAWRQYSADSTQLPYPTDAATCYTQAAADEAIRDAGLAAQNLAGAGCMLGTLSSADRGLRAAGF